MNTYTPGQHVLFAGALTALAGYVPVALPVVMPLWMVFSFFSTLPLLLLALHYGFDATLRAGGIAIGLALIGLYGLQMSFNVWAQVPQIVACVVASRYLLLSRQEQGGVEWYPAGHVLLMITGVIALSVAVASVVIEAGSPVVSPDELALMADQLAGASGSRERIEYTLEMLLAVAPALNGIGVLLIMILNGILAQKILARRSLLVRPMPTFKTIQLPSSYLWLFVVALGAAVFKVLGAVSANVAIVLALPYFIAGLSLAHQAIHRYNLGTIGAVVLYVGMVFFGWPVFLIFMAGLFEPWLRSNKEVNELLEK